MEAWEARRGRGRVDLTGGKRRFFLDEQQEGDARWDGRLSNDGGKGGWEVDTCVYVGVCVLGWGEDSQGWGDHLLQSQAMETGGTGSLQASPKMLMVSS